MSKSPSMEQTRFDVRLIEQRLRRGDVKHEEYETYLASLPDEAVEGEESKVNFTSPYGDKFERR